MNGTELRSFSHRQILTKKQEKLPGESIFCRVLFTYDMHQKNLFLVTSIFRTQP